MNNVRLDIKIAVLLSILFFITFDSTKVIALYSPREEVNKPESFGLGVFGIQVPHYMGAGEYYQFIIPFPFAWVNFTPNESIFYIKVDGNFTLPVGGEQLTAPQPSTYNEPGSRITGSRNYTRRGMGYLPPTLIWGPAVGLRLWPFVLEFSYTSGFQIGGRWLHAGEITKVTVEWHPIRNSSSARFYFSGKAFYTDEQYNQMFYGVSPHQVLSDRPEYNASQEGYLGYTVGMHFQKRFGPIMFTSYLEYQDLNNSIVEDSPLVRRITDVFGFAGLAYLFGSK